MITNLPENRDISVNIQSVYPNITLKSNDYGSTTYGPPMNIYIELISITDTSASLLFTHPLIQIDSSYNLFLNNKTNNTMIVNKNIVSPFRLTDLCSNSLYEMVLQSYYDNIGLYSNSKIIGFYTEGTVTGIQYYNATDTSIDLCFNICLSAPNSYKLNINGTKTIDIINNYYTITDLSSNTYYNTYIQSIYNNAYNTINVEI